MQIITHSTVLRQYEVKHLNLEVLDLNLKYLLHYSVYHVVIHFASISFENLALHS